MDSVQKQEISQELTENIEDKEDIDDGSISALRLINQRDGKIILIPNGKYMIGAYGDIETDYFGILIM